VTPLLSYTQTNDQLGDDAVARKAACFRDKEEWAWQWPWALEQGKQREQLLPQLLARESRP